MTLSQIEEIMAVRLLLGFTFFHIHGFVDAMEGNCRLFGCNAVVKFDLHTETCCDGTVYVRDLDENGNEKTQCCYGKNSTMYNVETQECCDGEVISKDSLRKGCCQGKVYNKETYTCCQGDMKNKMVYPCCGNDPVNPSSGVQCCGGNLYGNRIQTCCNGTLWNGRGECCGDVIMDPVEDKCCRHDGSIRLHMAAYYGSKCCGLGTYRPEKQLCCKSIVQIKIDNTIECCGNTTFNITREVCCQGHVLPRDTGKKSCCGGKLYDEDDEVCCKDKIYPGGGRAKCCDEVPYQEERRVCFNGVVLNSSIPQIESVVRLVQNTSTAYLLTNQFECGGKLITRSHERNACCNTTAYNTAYHLCCKVSGSSYELVEKSPSHDRCCGRASYVSTSHGCCNLAKVYDLENEICNEYGVHPRYGSIEAAKPCLQNKLAKDKVCKNGGTSGIPYNSNTSVCTPIGIMALPEGLEICGNKTFKRDLFICCRGNFFAKDVGDEKQECCPNPVGKETFIPARQVCLNGRIENIPKEHARICRGKVYDSRTHGCDVVGEVRSKEEIKEEPNVCWYNETQYSYFNETNEFCCNGLIINADYTCCAEEPDCCNPGDIIGYNRETHVCCGGVLRETQNRANDCRGNQCTDSHGNSFLCCQETLYDDVVEELTCDGNLLTGRLRNNSILCRGTLYDHGTDCCDDRSYDNETDMCCGGVIAARSNNITCCGNHVYEPANSDSLCCEPSFYQNAFDGACCGGVKYNLKNETCCTTGGKTYVFSSRDGLCCSNGEYYDDTLHTCCDGLVHKYIANGTCCGNNVIRDPTREGCYNQRIYQI